MISPQPYSLSFSFELLMGRYRKEWTRKLRCSPFLKYSTSFSCFPGSFMDSPWWWMVEINVMVTRKQKQWKLLCLLFYVSQCQLFSSASVSVFAPFMSSNAEIKMPLEDEQSQISNSLVRIQIFYLPKIFFNQSLLTCNQPQPISISSKKLIIL